MKKLLLITSLLSAGCAFGMQSGEVDEEKAALLTNDQARQDLGSTFIAQQRPLANAFASTSDEVQRHEAGYQRAVAADETQIQPVMAPQKDWFDKHPAMVAASFVGGVAGVASRYFFKGNPKQNCTVALVAGSAVYGAMVGAEKLKEMNRALNS